MKKNYLLTIVSEIKVEEMNRLIDEDLKKTSSEVRNITNLAKNLLSHKCNPRYEGYG